MPRTNNLLFVLLISWLIAGLGALNQALAQPTTSPYPARAPLSQYMMPADLEVELARSAAPKSISGDAQVMVLGRHGYETVAQGTNGFLCLVERSWGASTDDSDFWNPKVRSPVCFNSPAAKTFAPRYLAKTKLVLDGRSKSEIVRAIASALDKKELPALVPGAMCYMMSKEQYLNDNGKDWHPHLMFFEVGNAAKVWGANLSGSPVMAANDPEERATIFMVWVDHWSDSTAFLSTAR